MTKMVLGRCWMDELYYNRGINSYKKVPKMSKYLSFENRRFCGCYVDIFDNFG